MVAFGPEFTNFNSAVSSACTELLGMMSAIVSITPALASCEYFQLTMSIHPRRRP
jgi:hypothetical protein